MTRAEKWGIGLWIGMFLIAAVIAVTVETRADDPPMLKLKKDWVLYQMPSGAKWYFHKESLVAISELNPSEAKIAERTTTVYLQGTKFYVPETAVDFFAKLQSAEDEKPGLQ